jgi:type IV pilus assembly protein PilA
MVVVGRCGHMSISPRRSLAGDQGFTLIELLVVILIIGVLAAIAIPSFLNQTGKAYDASAKELARTAQTTAETYSTDHNGSFEGMTTAALEKYETGLKGCPNGANSCFVSSTPIESNGGYEVVTKAYKTGDEFTVKRLANGEVERKCKSASTGCAGTTSSTW